MKSVKSTTIEKLHRGIALIHTTDSGEVISLQFSKHEARMLMRRIVNLLGASRGEGE